MRILNFLLMGSLLVSRAAFADEFTGTLVDADCMHRNGGPHACDAGVNTTAFSLLAAGRAYQFTRAGNLKVSAAMKQRERLHDADPHYPYSRPPNALVTGQQAGKTIIVKRIVIE